jgi:hypothetical protein
MPTGTTHMRVDEDAAELLRVAVKTRYGDKRGELGRQATAALHRHAIQLLKDAQG